MSRRLKDFWRGQLLAIFSFLSALYFASRPSGLGQLLVMLAAVVTLAALLRLAWLVVSLWKHRTASRLVPPALVVAAFVLGIVLGGEFREWNFQRNLPAYERAAAWAESQARDDDIVVLRPPGEFSSLGAIIHVHKNATCGLMVDFFWAGGFPVKHIVRRHARNEGFTDIPACREHWSSGRQLADHWFELRD